MRTPRVRALAALLAAILLTLASPVLAGENFALHPLAARTAAGTGTAIDLGAWRTATVHARVTAGSGTVTVFDVWIECSPDGTNFTECAVDNRVKGTSTGAGAFTDNTVKVIVETAVVTSATYSAQLSAPPQWVRARWNITGTTPSETFEVLATAK